MEFHIDSSVRGYHIYNEVWTTVLGEVLITERELYNVADRYAVAVKKHSDETVGHLPKKTSMLCSMFIDKGGDITCVVTGNRRYSSDLNRARDWHANQNPIFAHQVASYSRS